MTRTQKIHKLANAIRAYRGVICTSTKKWKEAPDKGKLKSVQQYAGELSLNVEYATKLVDGFKTFDEFNAWLRELSNYETPTTLSQVGTVPA